VPDRPSDKPASDPSSPGPVTHPGDTP
jgi:hypothetical protein